jgi:hypothetical protein
LRQFRGFPRRKRVVLNVLDVPTVDAALKQRNRGAKIAPDLAVQT